MFFQEDKAIEVVTSAFKCKANVARTNPRQRTSSPPICARTPNTCSTRARGVAIMRLRCFCVSEMPLVACPHRWMCTRQPDCFNLDSYSRLVAPVGIHIAAGIVQVEKFLKYSGVRHSGLSDGDLADQLAASIDTGMRLVTKMIPAALFGPLGVDILLRTLVRFST